MVEKKEAVAGDSCDRLDFCDDISVTFLCYAVRDGDGFGYSHLIFISLRSDNIL
jgi:hypothetical protein